MIWLEPILYSVLIFAGSYRGLVCFRPARLSAALHSRAFSQHVKSLRRIWPIEVPLLEAIFARGSAVQNFAFIPRNPSILPVLSAMPLRRLQIELKPLFPLAGVDFTLPLFSHIAHLELRDRQFSDWEEWKGLALIPNLTHLAILREQPIPVLQGALAVCPALRILVCFYPLDKADPREGLESLAQDTRFVLVPAPSFITDWEIGARGGDDFWVRAERFTVLRNSDEIDRGIFVLPKA
ncbi:hypothetical protein K438DRAFT_1836395 [Mycena galopus ATCC 62051]|nr:hypothetical protein K438DRAFT_1836395 [Mycena galopus ATCC 62051]